MSQNFTNWLTLDIDRPELVKQACLGLLSLVFDKVVIYKTKNGLHVICYSKKKLHTKTLDKFRDLLQDPKKTKYDNKSKNPNAHKRLFTEKHKVKEIIIK